MDQNVPEMANSLSFGKKQMWLGYKQQDTLQCK